MRNALVIVASLGLAGLGIRTMLTAPASPGVTYIAAAEVTAAFAKGRPLLEVDGYKIHASRREGPGQVEIHTRDTDVVYVLEGGAEMCWRNGSPARRPSAPTIFSRHVD